MKLKEESGNIIIVFERFVWCYLNSSPTSALGGIAIKRLVWGFTVTVAVDGSGGGDPNGEATTSIEVES